MAHLIRETARHAGHADICGSGSTTPRTCDDAVDHLSGGVAPLTHPGHRPADGGRAGVT
ncbi:MAG: DinB family protein, partial [Actinomycetota bacterium]|nr:DinB family protein [Actinomycetota bacterium]